MEQCQALNPMSAKHPAAEPMAGQPFTCLDGLRPIAALARSLQRRRPGGTRDDPLVQWIEFDPALFLASAFPLAGIDCPDSIARSVSKRQAEFFFGRLAARRALTAAGSAKVDLPIGPGREPVWPAGFMGSITHVDRLAAAVAMPKKERLGVGIDLERLIDAQTALDIQKLVATRHELAHLRGLSARAALTLIFSAKEALFKAAFKHVGRCFDFSLARLVQADIDRRELVFELTDTLSALLVHGRTIVVDYEEPEPGLLFTACLI